jgi:hypothetical protein
MRQVLPQNQHGAIRLDTVRPRLLRQEEIERIRGIELKTRSYATAVQILGQGVQTRVFRHILPTTRKPSRTRARDSLIAKWAVQLWNGVPCYSFQVFTVQHMDHGNLKSWLPRRAPVIAFNARRNFICQSCPAKG